MPEARTRLGHVAVLWRGDATARRNATPEKVAGILFCGYQRELPTLAWTDDANLVVSAVRGDEKGNQFLHQAARGDHCRQYHHGIHDHQFLRGKSDQTA